MSRTLSILGYHKIGPPSPSAWETWYYVPTATFERQMLWLEEHRFTVIDAATFLAALDSPEACDALPQPAAMITFDDGYRSVLEHALPVLRRMGFPAVMFVPTKHVGGGSSWDADTREPVEAICTWSELRALSSAGVSVQSHAAAHRTFSDLRDAEVARELGESKDAIERNVGIAPSMLSYPYSDPGKDAGATDRALREAGYRAAMLFTGGVTPMPPPDRFRITRVPVWPDSDFQRELLSVSL